MSEKEAKDAAGGDRPLRAMPYGIAAVGLFAFGVMHSDFAQMAPYLVAALLSLAIFIKRIAVNLFNVTRHKIEDIQMRKNAMNHVPSRKE